MLFQDLLSPAGERPVTVPLGAFEAAAALLWPDHPSGLVVVAQACGGHQGAVELSVARELRLAGFATLHLDLLPRAKPALRPVESSEVLAARLLAVVDWARDQPELGDLAVGCFGSGDAAAAALRAAASVERQVRAVVCLGGRPDLAGPALGDLRAPALLIVGGQDEDALEPSRRAFRRLDCIKRLVVIERASRGLGEPGALDEAGQRAAGWLIEHLALAPRREERWRCRTRDWNPAAL